MKEGANGPLPDETRVLYISPLKALSNDIHRNLEAPLAGIRRELTALSLADVEIRTVVRTGDTTQSERAQMRRRSPAHRRDDPPSHSTVLLGSQSGRDMLATCRTVIVDEIHAIAGNKRGTHLALSLERLLSNHSLPLRPHWIVGHANTDRRGCAVSHRQWCADGLHPSSTAVTFAAVIWRWSCPPYRSSR